jgi:hypothetical protein
MFIYDVLDTFDMGGCSLPVYSVFPSKLLRRFTCPGFIFNFVSVGDVRWEITYLSCSFCEQSRFGRAKEDNSGQQNYGVLFP